MKLLDLLIELDPTVKELRDSEQFKLSKMIIKKRIGLELNQREFSKMIGIDFEELVKLEACDLDTTVKEYEEILEIIEYKVILFKLNFNIPVDYFNLKAETSLNDTSTFLKFNESITKILSVTNRDAYNPNLELENNVGIYVKSTNLNKGSTISGDETFGQVLETSRISNDELSAFNNSSSLLKTNQGINLNSYGTLKNIA